MTNYSVLSPSADSEGYGIKIVSIRLVYDISKNLAAISELCDKCNALDVDPVHFDCVLEDFLSQKKDF